MGSSSTNRDEHTKIFETTTQLANLNHMGCFRKWWVFHQKIIHCNGVFVLKTIHFGVPLFLETSIWLSKFRFNSSTEYGGTQSPKILWTHHYLGKNVPFGTLCNTAPPPGRTLVIVMAHHLVGQQNAWSVWGNKMKHTPWRLIIPSRNLNIFIKSSDEKTRFFIMGM